MIWADQTLSEGLRKGMPLNNLGSLIQLLQKLSVGIIDIAVDDCARYGVLAGNTLPPEFVRGKLNPLPEKVLLAYQMGFQNIMVAYTPQSGNWLTAQLSDSLLKARELNLNIALCVENASDFSAKEFADFYQEIIQFGVQTYIYSDGNSRLDALSTFKIMNSLVGVLPVALEFHAHNVYGMATANALGAVRAGVKRIATAVAGVGQNGHAALEEVIMACKRLFGEGNEATAHLADTCDQVLAQLGLELPANKAVVGKNIFAHESGIHVDGVIKNSQLYEIFPPQEVGLARQLVIGKYSGTASLQAKFRLWKIILNDGDAQNLLKKVRKLAVTQKRQLADADLQQLYQSML
ncbi:MAG TPA: pyruvate carboxyltransferase [Negativicutes bacterium]|jgi:homocitrate synthase NifV